MPNNRNTDEKKSPALDAEDWEIALTPYAGNHHSAISLACTLMVLKEYLQEKPPNVPLVLLAIEQAAETLYAHTDFPKGAYELYCTRIEGKATRADETLIESLGIEL